MKKAKVSNQNILIGIGTILLVLAAFFYLKPKNTTKPTPSSSPEEIIVQEEGTVKKTGEMIQPMNDEEIKKMRDEVDSVLISGGTMSQLEDVSGGLAKGEAKRAFSDGKFYYKIAVLDLDSVGKGYYYEGWLKKGDDYISIGRLETNNLGENLLYYTASVDRSEYSQTVVTLEPEDGNPAPGEHILEGKFN